MHPCLSLNPQVLAHVGGTVLQGIAVIQALSDELLSVAKCVSGGLQFVSVFSATRLHGDLSNWGHLTWDDMKWAAEMQCRLGLKGRVFRGL